MKFSFSLFFLASVIVISCKNGKELKTKDGFKYILYTNSDGEKAKLGDYVTLTLVYRNSKDSVIFDSRTGGKPIRFKLERIPFRGSYEDGLTYLAMNDSATFFVPADSLYNYMFRMRGGEMASQDKTEFDKGSLFRFDIKLLKVQNQAEAEEEMQLQYSADERKERQDLDHYLKIKNITAPVSAEGYYLLMRKNGNGESIDSGKVVTIEYEGRFLDDIVFEGTEKQGQTYKFISGTHHVIKGWELAMKKMRAGDGFTIVLPSKLAYGEEGIRDPRNGSYIVDPYTPLVYDIEIISVEDAPAVSGNN